MQPRPSAETSRRSECALLHRVSLVRVDHDLDRLALVHRAVAVRHAVEVRRAVEDAAGLDPALEDVGQQLLDVRARGRRAAGDGDVVEERRAASSGSPRAAARRRGRPRRRGGRCRAPSSTDWSCPTHSSTECAPRPPVSSRTRSTASSPRSLTTSVAPNSCASAIRSGWRPRTMICSAPSRFAAITPQSPTAPSPTTADGLARADPRGEGRVVAGSHHVGQREQRRHQRVVLADRQHDERAVGLRDAHGLALAAVDVVGAVPAAVEARGVQSLAAEDAGAVGPEERRDDEVAGLDRADVGADGLDDADELVAHAAAGLARAPSVVRPEVAAADRGAGDADERVGRLDQVGVGDVLDRGRRRRRT